MHWWQTINKAMNSAPVGAGQPTLRSGCRLWQRYSTLDGKSKMFQVFMMLLGFGGGILYVLQGLQLVPLKPNPNEAREKFKSRLNQRKFSGLILILIGLIYTYELAAAI